MTKRQHQLLLLLLFGMYSILGTIPSFNVAMNYVTWFGVIYIAASYIRLYSSPLLENGKLWRIITLVFIILSMASVIMMLYLGKDPLYFVSDSNRALSVIVAISSFLWLKNVKIPQSKFINAVGGATFGVFLIHTASDAMRIWLWTDTVNCVGHYALPLGKLIMFSFGVVLAVFIICVVIDRIRLYCFEIPFLSWFDKLNIN